MASSAYRRDTTRRSPLARRGVERWLVSSRSRAPRSQLLLLQLPHEAHERREVHLLQLRVRVAAPRLPELRHAGLVRPRHRDPGALDKPRTLRFWIREQHLDFAAAFRLRDVPRDRREGR